VAAAPQDDGEGGAMGLFDEAIAVRPGGEGVWHADLRDELTIVNGRPNGGYLLAVLGAAAVAELGDADSHVVSATASYISPPTVGPVTVLAEVRRRGRTASQVHAVMGQDDRRTVEVQMVLAGIDAAAPDWGNIAPVDLPPEAECRSTVGGTSSPLSGLTAPPLSQVLSLALDPATLGFASGRPGGEGEIRGWLRFVDDRPFDPTSLLLAVDALPPATFEIALTGWVPTLSLTAYIRAWPAPGPLRVRMRAGIIAGGRVDEACELWDSAGQLVAQSTQLAAIRLP